MERKYIRAYDGTELIKIMGKEVLWFFFNALFQTWENEDSHSKRIWDVLYITTNSLIVDFDRKIDNSYEANYYKAPFQYDRAKLKFPFQMQ